jgi:hypothetical protein
MQYRVAWMLPRRMSAVAPVAVAVAVVPVAVPRAALLLARAACIARRWQLLPLAEQRHVKAWQQTALDATVNKLH